MEDFTLRNVSKYILSAAISMKAAELTKETISDHTQFEDDAIVVKIGSGVVGWYAGHKTKPYTDQAVDKVADFVIAKREARKDRRKNDTPETEK